MILNELLKSFKGCVKQYNADKKFRFIFLAFLRSYLSRKTAGKGYQKKFFYEILNIKTSSYALSVNKIIKFRLQRFIFKMVKAFLWSVLNN